MASLLRVVTARAMAADGRHEDALQEYIWLFEHAHSQIRGIGAVRLSAWLADWAELGKVYPKARQALEAIRDRKTQLLRLRVGGWNMFHEVVSINEYLDCQHQTYQLFREMAESNPGLAERCFHIALPSILAAQDYRLAERFLGDPVGALAEMSEMLNRSVRCYKPDEHRDVPYLESQIDFYANRVKELLSVLEGCGRQAEAARMHALAIESVEVATLRPTIRAALVPGATPWYERDDDAGPGT